MVSSPRKISSRNRLKRGAVARGSKPVDVQAVMKSPALWGRHCPVRRSIVPERQLKSPGSALRLSALKDRNLLNSTRHVLRVEAILHCAPHLSSWEALPSSPTRERSSASSATI